MGRRTVRVALGLALALAGAVTACTPGQRPAGAPSACAVRGSAAVRGTVRNPDGTPIGGAVVAAVPAAATGFAAIAQLAVATADRGGGFCLAVAPGATHIVTATAAAHEAAAAGPIAAGATASLVLAPARQAFHGHARDEAGSPLAGARVVALAVDGGGGAFVTGTDARGAYRLALPAAAYHVLPLPARERPGIEPRIERRVLDSDDELPLALEPVAGDPPADAAPLVTWLRRAAVPLATVQAGAPTADLTPLAPVFAAARVVGLGEATHGSRELFQLKHRLVVDLAVAHGFTELALETGWAEALAVDAYVQGGPGDAASALAQLGMWPWQTEELVALVEDLRRYNLDPAHPVKLHIRGVDVQDAAAGLDHLAAYLARVEPDAAARVPASLLALRDRARLDALAAPTAADGAAALDAALDALRAQLAARRDRYQARAGAAAWTIADRTAAVLAQTVRWHRAGRRGPVRDLAMAENVRWLAERGPDTRVVLWAHNGHVAARRNWLYPTGMHLRDWFGIRYVAVGLFFHHGGFQAIDPATDRLAAFEVGPPAHQLEALLAQAGHDRFFLDLRGAPTVVQPWLTATTTVRQADAVYVGPRSLDYPTVLARDYDAIAFVAETSRAVPTAAARARYADP